MINVRAAGSLFRPAAATHVGDINNVEALIVRIYRSSPCSFRDEDSPIPGKHKRRLIHVSLHSDRQTRPRSGAQMHCELRVPHCDRLAVERDAHRLVLGVGAGLDHQLPTRHRIRVDQHQRDPLWPDPLHKGANIPGQAGPSRFEVEVTHLRVQDIATAAWVIGPEHQVDEATH